MKVIAVDLKGRHLLLWKTTPIISTRMAIRFSVRACSKSVSRLRTPSLDLSNRFRLLVNEVDVVKPAQPLPKLPVARAVWECRPCFKTACAAWIYARRGTHHTGFSYAVTTQHMEDFAEIAGLEPVVIDGETELPAFKQQLRYNEIYYHLAPPDWGVCSTQFQPHRHWEPVEQLLGLRAILKSLPVPLQPRKLIMWAEALFSDIAQVGKLPAREFERI